MKILIVYFAMSNGWQMQPLVFSNHIACNAVEQSLRTPARIKWSHVQRVFEVGGGRPLFFIPCRGV